MKFTVLMSIYSKESPLYFDRAMSSIWDDQTVKPVEIVLVEDGPLPIGLLETIDKWKKRLGSILKIIELDVNVGTGCAKKIGINHCTSELIAVMDTDDVSYPNRFVKQLAVFEKYDIDVCGGWVDEFADDENAVYASRRTPRKHDEIVKFAKIRSPVNHPTSMYKREAVLKVGGYGPYRSSQDYHLFIKMLISGAKFYNIQESLVNMRVGNGQLENRRSGLKNVVHEITVQREFYRLGFLNTYEFVRNILVGSSVRILPKVLVRLIFKLIRKL